MVKFVGPKSLFTASSERMMQLVIRKSITGPVALLLKAAQTEFEIPVMVLSLIETRADSPGLVLAETETVESTIRQRRIRASPLKMLIPLASSPRLLQFRMIVLATLTLAPS